MSDFNYKFKKIFNAETSIVGYGLFKYLPLKGNLVYEYNPFRNYRLTNQKYLYNSKFYSEKLLIDDEQIFSQIIFSNKLITLNNLDYNSAFYSIYKTDNITQNKNICYISVTYSNTSSIQSLFPILFPGFNTDKLTEDNIKILTSYKFNLSIIKSDLTGQFKFEHISDNIFYLRKIGTDLYIKYDNSSNVLLTTKSDASIFYLTNNKIYYNTLLEYYDTADFSYDSNSNSTFYWFKENKCTAKGNNEVILYDKDSCVDFITDELTFDIMHPVDIVPLYSYDGSVNLILTDGNTFPKLINSRFSATGRNTYLIVDRKGDNDTNIYTEGLTFNTDISLHTEISTIALVEYLGTCSGNLPCGNYHFYFTYSDADGNETDFFAESGLVSLFVGNSERSIRQGFRNENSYKGVQFYFNNLDEAYSYINVYYSRSTGDILQDAETIYQKINNKFYINNSNITKLIITGYEEALNIDVSTINQLYTYVKSAETLCAKNNLLFLGNITKLEISYSELEDLSLHFLPYLNTSKQYNLNSGSRYNNENYRDSKFIYNFTGYWPEEIYRLGIVYILNDGNKTPVFNIRGMYNICEYYDNQFTNFELYDEDAYEKTRKYINYDSNSYLLSEGKLSNLENSKGVVTFKSKLTNLSDVSLIYGIEIRVDSEDVFTELKKYVKGFYFVRLKRIPTILCLGISTATDNNNHHLAISDNGNYTEESFLKLAQYTYVPGLDIDDVIDDLKKKANLTNVYIKNLTDDNDIKYLDNTFLYHKIQCTNSSVNALICPDYDINYPYLNNILNGSSLKLTLADFQPNSNTTLNSDNERSFYYTSYKLNSTNSVLETNVLGIEDSTPLVKVGDTLFSGLAGIPSMGYKFDFVNYKDLHTDCTNIVRGVWGPFVGLGGTVLKDSIYNIYIPNYNSNEMSNYFSIRYSDLTSYYAISLQLDITTVNLTIGTFYRGDCYICKYTHRFNRNFNDDSSPYNDDIVNPGTWAGKNNGQFLEDYGKDYDSGDDKPGFTVKDGVIKTEYFEWINIGDINTVNLGMWLTFYVRSSINLNIRALDESDTEITAKTGHSKGFYPYLPMSAAGPYKHSEALVYNKGYETSVSSRYNYNEPDVPAIKNCFANRIMYSLPLVMDAFANGYRNFISTHYADFTMEYGSITKILPFMSGILVIFEHGIIAVPVNERALLNLNGNIYVETAKVISNNLDANSVISKNFGSLWKDSIIQTPQGVYGVDTVAKKIWKTDGTKLEIISDFKILKYLNDNITLTERELTPILGIRNVKTHFNAFKNDVIFTFYDNLEGIYEHAWSLCWNENLGSEGNGWITFYSWIPSFSENIYNEYFSFDRQTLKWIAKLGLSSANSSWRSKIYLSNVIFDNTIKSDSEEDVQNNNGSLAEIAEICLDYDQLNLPDTAVIEEVILLRDNLLNYKNFCIKQENDSYKLCLNYDVAAVDLCSEVYVRLRWFNPLPMYHLKTDSELLKQWKEYISNGLVFDILKNNGQRVYLDLSERVNDNKICILLNLELSYSYDNTSLTILNTVCVIPLYNMLFLTTDFWKHGQAGIIDISDKVYPTYWYGKLHPFEFEFIVNKALTSHKIFDNLIIISNNAEPESFHYEIVGDSYDFIDDKPNMYYRQEATEAFYQYNGSDIEYDTNFTEVKDELNHKQLYNIGIVNNGTSENEDYQKEFITTENDYGKYVKSNLPLLYYNRTNSYNEIEDYYQLKTCLSKNYEGKSGTEIVRDPLLKEYHLWEHVKAVNVKSPLGRLHSNMEYKENFWRVLIPPIYLYLKNEDEWKSNIPPIVIDTSSNPTIPEDIQGADIDVTDMFPEVLIKLGYKNLKDKEQPITDSPFLAFETWNKITQIKLKDRYMKVKIRYTGNKLAIIQSVLTLFRVSYA